MIRLLSAFAYLRWRLFVNGLRARRRDALEAVSRVSRLVVVVLVAVTFVPGAATLALLAFVGARGLALGNARAAAVAVGARAGLAVATIAVAVTPILRFGGAASSMARLALLPIPRRLLWWLELAAQAVDPWILALVPALAALPLGFAAGGSARGALVAAAASLGALAFLVALSSAASLGGALLFRNRRAGELAAIGLLLGITIFAYLPILGRRGSDGAPRAVTIDAHRAFGDAAAHPWVRVLPWEGFGAAIERAAPGGPGSPLPALAALAAAAVALAAVSRWAFGRLMDGPASAGPRSRAARASVPSIPGLSPAASAVAVATLRLLTRSVRGRVMLFTAPVPGVMIGLVWRTKHADLPGVPAGVVVAVLGGMLGLVSLQAFLSDQFAVDRAGLTLTFLAPIGERELVVGKAVAGAVALAVPTGLALLAGAILLPGGAPALWIAAIVGTAGVYLLQAPVSALLAALFPARFDLMKLKAGNAHPLATLAGTFTTLVAALLAGAAGALGAWLGGGPWGILAGISVFAAASLGIAAAALPSVARAVRLRRENLAMVAQGR